MVPLNSSLEIRGRISELENTSKEIIQNIVQSTEI